MKTLWNSSNYGNDLRLTRADANYCNQSGDCTQFVKEVMKKPYVKKQLALFKPSQLRKELREYGAWEARDVKDHNDNLRRWVWISAGDIAERN
jgi:hypothetical protein